MTEFVKDLAAAQSEMGNAAYNRTNPHFKSKYADFAAVREATLPVLTKYGFAIIQTTDLVDGVILLKTELAHKSGESRISSYPIAPGTPQQQGSALTYARRYSWSAITGIASEEDDDGNAAQGAAQNSTGAATAHEEPKKLTKAAGRAEYEKLQNEIRAIDSVEKLKAWGSTETWRIQRLPDDWRAFIRDCWADRKAALELGVTEDGEIIEETAA
jgi:hypothetical protein